VGCGVRGLKLGGLELAFKSIADYLEELHIVHWRP